MKNKSVLITTFCLISVAAPGPKSQRKTKNNGDNRYVIKNRMFVIDIEIESNWTNLFLLIANCWMGRWLTATANPLPPSFPDPHIICWSCCEERRAAENITKTKSRLTKKFSATAGKSAGSAPRPFLSFVISLITSYHLSHNQRKPNHTLVIVVIFFFVFSFFDFELNSFAFCCGDCQKKERTWWCFRLA